MARKLIAGAVCAFAQFAPAESRADWQMTKRENANGTIWTYRQVKPTSFEIANPEPGEARCVGYLNKRR